MIRDSLDDHVMIYWVIYNGTTAKPNLSCLFDFPVESKKKNMSFQMNGSIISYHIVRGLPQQALNPAVSLPIGSSEQGSADTSQLPPSASLLPASLLTSSLNTDSLELEELSIQHGYISSRAI
jgi:hypothetical protein